MGCPASGVEGYVTRRSNGVPISGANITTNTGTAVSSDENGYYYFPHNPTAPGSITMYCSAGGYSNWTRDGIILRAGVGKVINIKMVP